MISQTCFSTRVNLQEHTLTPNTHRQQQCELQMMTSGVHSPTEVDTDVNVSYTIANTLTVPEEGGEGIYQDIAAAGKEGGESKSRKYCIR